MKVIKFKVEKNAYDEFKNICVAKESSVKTEMYKIMLDDHRPEFIHDYFPENQEEIKKITLKVNEDFFSGVMHKCRTFEFSAREYLAYLIYKGLFIHKNS